MQKWSRIAGLKKFTEKRHATFKEYNEFVKKEAFLATNTTTSMRALSAAATNKRGTTKAVTHLMSVDSESVSTDCSADKTETIPQAMTHSSHMDKSEAAVGYFESNPTDQKVKKVCYMCKWVWATHDTADCPKLCALSQDNIQSFMKKEHLCFLCLRKGHGQTRCYVKLNCGECKGKHATCLHSKQTQQDSNGKTTVTSEEVVSLQINSDEPAGLTTMILPVFVSTQENPENEILVYAMVDNMSNTSYLLDSVASDLQARRGPAKLQVSTIVSTKHKMPCELMRNLRVRGMNSTCRLTIPKTYTARAVPGDRDNIPTPETARQWSHLEHLHSQIAPLQTCEIALLIGFNCSAAHLRLKQVEGSLNDPFGVETPLGWSIIGGACTDTEQIHFTHKIVARELTPDEVLQCLSEDLDSDHHGIPTSHNDILFMKKMDESTSQENGHYIMPLPFKETPSLPNNRSNAMKRFRSLARKLHSDPQLNTKYREFMEDIIAKGEAEISNSSHPGWYIPHFGVSHPLKPDELQVVFDCSAVYRGHSLNQHLLQGPDLNNNLTGLLCRFRKEKVALTCDIQRMFHQFRVAKNDRRFLRFFMV